MEPGVGVDAALGLAARGEADIGDQGTLWGQAGVSRPPLRCPSALPGWAPTSSRSSQWVPLPRKPTGQEPQDQEPSGKLLHWAPGKQGLDRQPSAWGAEWSGPRVGQPQEPGPGATRTLTAPRGAPGQVSTEVRS